MKATPRSEVAAQSAASTATNGEGEAEWDESLATAGREIVAGNDGIADQVKGLVIERLGGELGRLPVTWRDVGAAHAHFELVA